MKIRHKISTVLAIAFAALSAQGQVTKVRGHVKDARTGAAMPLVVISLPGATANTTTDFEGNYSLETRQSVSRVTASYLTYEAQTAQIKPGAFNQVDFALRPLDNSLETIVVTFDDSPARRVHRMVCAHKAENNPDNHPDYRCATYTKMELDLANMKDGFKSRTMQKNFGFVFNYMDTSAVTGKAYLPVMISESRADYYYRRSPRLSREVVHASRISGISEDFTLAQFTGQLHAKVNVYDDFINIFYVNFVSPLNDSGNLYYKYYLTDSTYIDGRKNYKLRFRPKVKSYPVFEGELHIDSLTWAVTGARMRMARDLNINWIRDLMVETTHAMNPQGIWMPQQDRLTADFSVTLRDSTRMRSFMGQRQVDYSDIVVGGGIPATVERMTGDLVMGGDVLRNDESYWQGVRPHELSPREQGIYSMVDSIRNVPLFNTFYDVMNTFVFGYMPVGKKIEVGPYYKLYSYNEFEGSRFQFGARTTSDWSKRLRLSAFAAYATGDGTLKGGGEVEYMLGSQPTSKIDLYARRDVQQLGSGQGAFTTGNVMATILSRGNTGQMTLVDQAGASWEKEWTSGFSNTFAFDFRHMMPNPTVDFITPSGERIPRINAAELSVGTRLSKNETMIRSHFNKASAGSDYPIFGFRISGGLRGVMGCDYDYAKLDASVMQDIDLPPMGYSRVLLSAGGISGKLPYPLLKLHEGNSTYFYDLTAFSCMNFYEFASDRWASAIWEHHFKGFFLGKIPVFRKLRMREVVTAKALWGSLTERNDGSSPGTDAVLLFPEGMSAVGKPYVEAGVGVENIMRIFRVDAMWRLTHREGREPVDNFALNISFGISF